MYLDWLTEGAELQELVLMMLPRLGLEWLMMVRRKMTELMMMVWSVMTDWRTETTLLVSPEQDDHVKILFHRIIDLTCSNASSSSFSFLFSCSIFCLSFSFISMVLLLISCCSLKVLSLINHRHYHHHSHHYHHDLTCLPSPWPLSGRLQMLRRCWLVSSSDLTEAWSWDWDLECCSCCCSGYPSPSVLP